MTAGLHNKLKQIRYTEFLESYLIERNFRVKPEDGYSNLREIKTGVPQGSVWGPLLYLMYKCDLQNLQNNTVTTFVDDTAIISMVQQRNRRNSKKSYNK